MSEEQTFGEKLIGRLEHARDHFDELDKRVRANPLPTSRELLKGSLMMLRMVFDPRLSSDDRESSRMTLLEIIAPDVLHDSIENCANAGNAEINGCMFASKEEIDNYFSSQLSKLDSNDCDKNRSESELLLLELLEILGYEKTIQAYQNVRKYY